MTVQDINDLVIPCNDAECSANTVHVPGLRLHSQGVGAALHEGQTSI